MSYTKFTLGPWWVSENTLGNPEIRTHRDEFDVEDLYSDIGATLCGSIGDHTEKRTSGNEIHNAYLIAAAPELYEALQRLQNGEGLQPGRTIEGLLAKARGES